MPEPTVLETDPIVDPIDPSADPSQADPIDPVPADPQDPENGDPIDPIDPGDPIDPNADPEPTATDKKPERREQYWKRQAEKHERELNELKTKPVSPAPQPPQFTSEQMIKAMAQKHGYNPEDPSIQSLIPLIQEIAANVSERQVSPLQNMVYSSQYEIRKSELAKDPKWGRYISNPDVMAEVDKMAKNVPPGAFTNQESTKSLIRYVIGDPDMQEKLLKNAGARAAKKATQEKRIDNVVISGGSKITGVETKGKLTAKQAEIAGKMGIPEDKFLKSLQDIEKSKGK